MPETVRQAGYAASRGMPWLVREPQWWIAAAAIRMKREPLPWKKYRAWMGLVRQPIFSEADWIANFGGPPAR